MTKFTNSSSQYADADAGPGGNEFTGNIATKRLNSLADIPLSQWTSLIENCPDSTVFQSPEWITAWWQTFGEGQYDLHLHAAYANQKLVGLAPLYVTSRKKYGLTLTELRFIGDGHSDYNVFPAWGGNPSIINALLDAIHPAIQSNIAAMLFEVPQTSMMAAHLRKMLYGGLTGVHLNSTTPCPRLKIRGNEAEVSNILKKNSLRRHAKSLGLLGTLSVSHTTKSEEILDRLPAFFQQHIERWNGTASISLFKSQKNQEFYNCLVEKMDGSNQLIFSSVSISDRPVAMHLGFSSQGEFIWYKPCFDVSLHLHGPGEVLLKSLIEYAKDSGYAVFDFSRGDEKFKSRFSSSINQNLNFEWIPARFDRRLLQLARFARRRWRKLRRS